jgi:hypothetical protein
LRAFRGNDAAGQRPEPILEDDMMKKSLMIATFLVVGAGAAGVGADIGSTANMKGSDTLFDLTTAMIAACPGAVGPYGGTGSGNGEGAMQKSTQAIAPMSRFLSNKVCTGAVAFAEAGIPAVPNATQAQGIVIGLDGVLIVGSKDTYGKYTPPGSDAGACENGSPNSACDPNFEPGTGARYTKTTITLDASCGGGSYTFTGWRDMLRVLFAGMDDNNPLATGTGAAAWGARDCNSCVRQTLANHYGNFFEGNCTATSGENVGGTNVPCAQLRHIFRRDDFSGTTDTIVGLLNLPSVVNPGTSVTVFPGGVSTVITQNTGANPFCNAVRPAFVMPGTANPAAAQSATNPQMTSLQAPDSTWDPTSSNLVNAAGGSGFCLPACAAGQVCLNSACVAAPACTPLCAAGSVCTFGNVCIARAACTAANNCAVEPTVFRSTMQDNDPIRRPCVGACNIAGVPCEDVCTNSGDLGLVLPMNDVPEAGGTNGTTNGDRYNPTACGTLGATLSVGAPNIYDAITQAQITCQRGALCPAGDVCTNTNACLAPAESPAGPQGPACLANKVTFSGLPISSRGVPAVHAIVPNKDKRAYNQHLYKLSPVSNAFVYQFNAFASPFQVTGAYYRIHTAHSLEPVVAADGGVLSEEDGGTEEARTCQQVDMTDQIGCLVESSPCSIGYAGRGATANVATNDNASTNGIKINQQIGDPLCITGNDAGVKGFTYPLARKLYLNTIRGFANVSGSELQLSGCETDLAQPGFVPPTGAGIMNTNVGAAGFLPIPGYINGGEPYCEDFNENMLCGGDGGTPNFNTCDAGAPNFSNFPTFNTTCGDGIQDPLEDCDCGSIGTPSSDPRCQNDAGVVLFNGAPGGICTTTCRNVF